MATIAWRPGPEHLARSRLLRFARSLGCAGVDELHRRAVADPGAYWAAVERDLGVRWTRRYDRALDLSDGVPFARFFAGGRMNYVASAVDRWADERPDAPAIAWESEEGATGTLTYRELRDEVCRATNALRALGVGPGDRVGLFMPLTAECAIALLACARAGAIVAPIFSGYGAEAVATRLADAEARLLIAADGFPRRGRRVAMKATADAAVARAPSVERVLVVCRVGGEVPWRPERDVWWHELVPGQSTQAELADTAADDPFMLIYTSGTTGRPKGTVHVHGGFPIKAAHDLAYCFDAQPGPDAARTDPAAPRTDPTAARTDPTAARTDPAAAASGDRVFWYTDVGWVMGPWLVASALMLGVTAVLYDGAVDHPEADRLWAVVERQRATVLGFSPTGVRALMRQPIELVRRHDLSSLRALGSTGEPWNEEPWWWYFREVGGGRCPVINFSGGTEASGGMLSGLTTAPCAPCAFNGPTPDMALDVVDEHGASVRGQVGELVVRGPWVGMTQGLWRDRERYLETYWSRWPNVWVHGDWARVDEDTGSSPGGAGSSPGGAGSSPGGAGSSAEGAGSSPEGAATRERVLGAGAELWYILGRSDDTIKVAGKRVGPAEVESVAVGHPAVAEAAAIGVPDELKGEVLVVLVVLRPGPGTRSRVPDETLRRAIAERIVEQMGPTLRPAAVRFATELPKTRNAKVLRRAIRGAYLGLTELGDLSGLENPDALAAIRASR